jgi:hypothetical protein
MIYTQPPTHAGIATRRQPHLSAAFSKDQVEAVHFFHLPNDVFLKFVFISTKAYFFVKKTDKILFFCT